MSPADLKEHYSELVALTKLYLLREHSPKEWKICEEESFAFFKAQAQKQKKPQTSRKIEITPVEPPPIKEIAPPPKKEIAPLPTPPRKIETTTVEPPPIKEIAPLPTPPRKIETTPVEPPPIKEIAPLPTPPRKIETTPVEPPPIKEITPPPEAKIETEKPKKKSDSPSFQLNPPKEHPAVDCSDVKQALEKLFPQLTLIPTPPDDREAKKMLLYKQTTFEIAILSFDTKTPPFLTHVANAISQEYSTAKVISAQRVEKEKKWNQLLSLPHLKLIIASDYGLYSYPELMQHYKEVPKQAKAYLAKIPLLLLADLSLYLKEPKLKPALWRAICEQLRDD